MSAQFAEAVEGQAREARADDFATLFRLTDRLYRARTPADVYEAALDAIRDALGCERASILLFDAAGVMQFVAWRGLSDGYRVAVTGHSPWKVGDRDPEPIFVADIDRSGESDAIKATIRSEGIRGLAFMPLVAQGLVIGKFMTYYPAPHDFAPREIELAVMIARQLGFSLERMRAEQARQAAEAELRGSEERFRVMSENAPVMIWTSDARGHCLHLNAMMRSFWNVAEADIPDFSWASTIHPDDVAAVGARMQEAVATRQSALVTGRYRNAEGRYRVLQTNARPHFAADGTFLGLIGVNVDVTEREEAEHDLRDSEERFRRAVEAAPSGMVMTDESGRIVLVNEQAERLFGYSREDLVGRPVEMLVPMRYRGTHPHYRAEYAGTTSARPMGAGRELFALRKDGSEVPVEIGLSPIETEDGVMTLAAVVDISERKQAEAQRELLLAELNHRVKNTLAVVQAIAHQTFRDGDGAATARAAFEGRLVALAAAHNLLTQANWQSASLHQLAADAVQALGANRHRVAIEGPRVLLSPKPALSIALALHELCTNAVKYGSLSNASGTVAVGWVWQDGEPPRLRLEWREEGGPPVVPPKRRGFGSRLVERSLAHDLEGEVALAFRPEGVLCTIEAPIHAEARLT